MYEEAIEAFKQVIRIDPDKAEAHYMLGAVYMHQPLQSGATSVNAGNVYISKDSRVYHHDRNCTNLRTTDNLMEFASPQDAKNAGGIPCNYCGSSIVRIEQSGSGMYKEAIEALKQAIRINPDYAMAHHYLGWAYGNLGMNKEAIDEYKQAIEAFKQETRINPDDATAHFYLGFAHVIFDDRGSALEQYKILKNLDSEKANQLFNMIYK
jgi:tetratricopeptide (TPR) repeat protein